jgi:hypothetical protein
MSDRSDERLKDYFRQPARLPTNFEFLVMQRISGRRLTQARKRAQWQSSLITVAMALSMGAMLFVLGLFFELPKFQLPFDGTTVLPALMVLVVAFLLDTGFAARKKV